MDSLNESQDPIFKAFEFARRKHKGQKYGNLPFTFHLMQTYQLLRTVAPEDENLLCAAVLHDTIENTQTTLNELQDEFNDDVANLVWQVTKAGYNTFPNLKTQRGYMLKFADRLSNLSHMKEWSTHQKSAYMQKSVFWRKV